MLIVLNKYLYFLITDENNIFFTGNCIILLIIHLISWFHVSPMFVHPIYIHDIIPFGIVGRKTFS